MSTYAGRLARNKIVRDLDGNIIDWYNEAQGGWIIQKRQIVNQEVWNAFVQKEIDKREAAKAVSQAKIREEDISQPTKEIKQDNKEMKKLEKRVNDMDKKLDAIINALNK